MPMSHRSRLTAPFLCILPLAVLFGCSSTEPATDFSGRVIPDARPDEIYAAGREILAQEFDRIAAADPVARRIETAPKEFTTRRDSGTARDLYRNPTRMRRYAILKVDQDGAETLARIHVEIEREDTKRAEQLERPYVRFSDYPHDSTPAERDASTTERQNVVWSKVRRDRELENDLLSQLARRLQSGSLPTASAPAGRTPVDEESLEPEPIPARDNRAVRPEGR